MRAPRSHARRVDRDGCGSPPGEYRCGMGRIPAAAALVALCVLVVAVRSVGIERVCPASGPSPLLAVDDAQYHARRAAFTADHLPAVLWFDPYLNHPHGAMVPWPPLYDFALGAAGRALGDLAAVLVWAPVAFAVATAFAVYGAGRRLGGRAVGLAAVAWLALLPASTRYTSVGNPDHHAAVAWLASLLLLGNLAVLAAEGRPRRLWAGEGALTGVRLALLGSWHGSVLYALLAEGLAGAVAAGHGRGDALRAQAVGCAVAAAGGVAALALPHSSYGGAWSAVEPSRLQPAVYAAAAGVAAAGALALVRRARAARPLGWRSGLAAVGIPAALAGAVLLALAWDSLSLAWAYAARSEAFIAFNYESQPLWRGGFASAFELYGGAALLLPLTPLAGLWAARRGRSRAAGHFLAGWTALLLVLAVSNARYGSDFAPAVSLSFALLGAGLVRRVAARHPRWRTAAGAAACAAIPLLLWRPIADLAPPAGRSLDALLGHPAPARRRADAFTRSVYAFVDRVRATTPETAGWDDPREHPAYGIVVPPTLGFIVNARARRATPAGNFGPYVGREGLEATNRFYLARDEPAAMRETEGLAVRYVITTDEGRAPGVLWHRLHHGDGSATRRRPGLGHFRLVTESPRPGVPLGALRGAAPDFVDVPYKLFEIVPGAVLEVAGSPGEVVVAELEVRAPEGRRFPYRTFAIVPEAGPARLRVPYATDAAPDPARDALPGAFRRARAVGPYRVAIEGRELDVEVSERQVAEGAAVPVAR